MAGWFLAALHYRFFRRRRDTRSCLYYHIRRDRSSLHRLQVAVDFAEAVVQGLLMWYRGWYSLTLLHNSILWQWHQACLLSPGGLHLLLVKQFVPLQTWLR